jgi:hypothetical protein
LERIGSRLLPLGSTLTIAALSATSPPLAASFNKKNSPTFFGTDLYETFGEKDQPCHLDPFRHDIAHYLAPFAVDVHS